MVLILNTFSDACYFLVDTLPLLSGSGGGVVMPSRYQGLCFILSFSQWIWANAGTRRGCWLHATSNSIDALNKILGMWSFRPLAYALPAISIDCFCVCCEQASKADCKIWDLPTEIPYGLWLLKREPKFWATESEFRHSYTTVVDQNRSWLKALIPN